MAIKHKYINSIIKEKNDDERSMVVVGSKQIMDRDKDIVDLESIKLKNYKNNPLFIWSHRPTETPENILGKATKVWVEDKKLMFKLEFLPPEVNSRADMVYKMYQFGALNSFSIGFMPDLETSEYDAKRGGYNFKDVELFEISAVGIPANPAALVESKEFKEAVEKGVIDKAEVDDFKLFLESLPQVETVDKVDDATENKSEQTITKCEECGHDLECPFCNKQKEVDPYAWIFSELESKPQSSSRGKDAEEILKLLGIK